MRSAKNIHRPETATLAAAFPRYAHFAQATAKRNPSLRVCRDKVYGILTFLIRHDCPGAFLEFRKFNYCLKSRRHHSIYASLAYVSMTYNIVPKRASLYQARSRRHQDGSQYTYASGFWSWPITTCGRKTNA